VSDDPFIARIETSFQRSADTCDRILATCDRIIALLDDWRREADGADVPLHQRGFGVMVLMPPLAWLLAPLGRAVGWWWAWWQT
jgi:hypothetical protein